MKEIFLAVLVAGVYVGAGLLVLSGRDKQPAKDMDKDVTVLYNTRPMGSGTAHSGKAREMLQEFLVEKLE